MRPLADPSPHGHLVRPDADSNVVSGGGVDGKTDRESRRRRGEFVVEPTEGVRQEIVPEWDGRVEHPVKGVQLALLSGLLAAVISSEGVRRGWYSAGLEVAASLGVPWSVPVIAATLAALGSYTWAEAWRFGKRPTILPIGNEQKSTDLFVQDPLDRAYHAALQGISATLGAAAMLLVVPGGSGLASGNLGGGLPPDVMAAVLRTISPGSLVLAIGMAVTVGSWWGWDRFGPDGVAPPQKENKDTH